MTTGGGNRKLKTWEKIFLVVILVVVLGGVALLWALGWFASPDAALLQVIGSPAPS